MRRLRKWPEKQKQSSGEQKELKMFLLFWGWGVGGASLSTISFCALTDGVLVTSSPQHMSLQQVKRSTGRRVHRVLREAAGCSPPVTIMLTLATHTRINATVRGLGATYCTTSTIKTYKHGTDHRPHWTCWCFFIHLCATKLACSLVVWINWGYTVWCCKQLKSCRSHSDSRWRQSRNKVIIYLYTRRGNTLDRCRLGKQKINRFWSEKGKESQNVLHVSYSQDIIISYQLCNIYFSAFFFNTPSFIIKYILL